MLLSLPIVYQSFANQPHPFYYIGHIFALATNYSNLMYQCFTNHYQSDPVPIHHYQSSVGNFLPVGSQCFTNHQFTNGTIGNDMWVSSASNKAKLFAKNISKNSNLDDLGISFLFFLLELL